MKTQCGLVVLGALILALTCSAPADALDVTLDSGGSGSTTISDTDLDGIIDFDLVVGGVFRAKGRVFESFGTITKTVTLTSTPPDAEAVFGKIGVGAGTAAFTVTVNTTAFTATGPPLGWTVSYVGSAEDALAGIVEIPTHFVDASVNAGTIPLTMVNGLPILATVNTPIDLAASGVNAADSATDVRVVFSFTPGPDDEILLPDNNGLDDKSIEVNVFNQSDACIDRMNNDARRVALSAQKSDFKCVKKGSGNVTACVDDPAEPKTDGKEQKLIADFANRCDPVPAWGVNGATCCEGGANDGGLCLMPAACPGGACVGGACISAAAETGAGAITHDLFGATVTVASDRDAANCQGAVIQRAGKLYAARWKAFRKCKKDNFMTITGDPTLISVCLGPPQSDERGVVAKELVRLSDKVQKKCIDRGVTPVGAQFAGVCNGAVDGLFADCVSDRVSCRFCEAVNRADAIVPPLNCDLFDDAASSGSCP